MKKIEKLEHEVGLKDDAIDVHIGKKGVQVFEVEIEEIDPAKLGKITEEK